jgi:CubicO group peptidase (beta-lactamase class C family)
MKGDAAGAGLDAGRLQRIEPLGMTDTGFRIPADKVDRFAACYGRNSRKELVLTDDPATSTYLHTPKLLNGGGGLVGTTGDYVRFCTMLATAASSTDDGCSPARRWS